MEVIGPMSKTIRKEIVGRYITEGPSSNPQNETGTLI